MRARHFKNSEEAEINITPMLDVVFIMLIFFIVSTSFVKESGLAIFRSNQSPQPTPEVKVANIKLNNGSSHSVNGIETDLGGIQALLTQFKAENPEVKVQIMSSNEIKTGDLVNVIQQVKNTKIESYSLSSF
jgi:biopolymer transport protein ExbD